MFNTLTAAVIALSCLALGEASAFGPLVVRRSSLDGFDVAGLGAGLDAEEAAAAVAQAAALAASAAPTWAELTAGAVVVFPRAALHADLLRGPCAATGGRRVETWREGRAADRRYEALRRALGGQYVHRTTYRACGFKTLAEASTVEILYQTMPISIIPAIERAR